MTQFDDREKAFEAKFAHDSELRFKAEVRRNKLLGLWAAGQLGLSGAEADAYAKTIIEADFAEAGDEDVFRKVRADFDAKNLSITDHQIRNEMHSLLEKAMLEVAAS
jgi:hypothetical protein